MQNLVGRAELMMALFFVCGFLAYAHGAVGCSAATGGGGGFGARTVCGIGLVLACTLGSMLCKETGATLPLLCVAWDCVYVISLRRALSLLLSRAAPRLSAVEWRAAAGRASLLLGGCAGLAWWRARLNGTTQPSINVKQNLPGFHPDPAYRALSVSWVWLEYIWTAVVPNNLCCDWSAPAIPRICPCVSHPTCTA